ncbi:MerR family transcriptional regulator [Pseudoalteromonas sp. SSDWG2]|uniref:MerR family transcriptional regulator n=1 Tax=Pseudoalteromonas sp. SSDWG2 TaxID=3139391 RepID=UPI003BAD7B3B
MYKISEFAAALGLSRTAVLHYEKQQLISGVRLDNGYRIYSDKDLQRMRLVLQLHAGGLTLKECKACLDAKIDKKLLQSRLITLDEEIKQKQQAYALLSAMLGQGDLKHWHQELECSAPYAHLDWLITQGFSEKEALRLKWLSKDMNEHEQYMADFMTVFSALERWAPGSEADTKKALAFVPEHTQRILEVGCGKGLATEVLANSTGAAILAVDNEQAALDALRSRFEQLSMANRLETLCASMTELPIAQGSVELIWSEGSAYIMGVEKALRQWRPLLQNHGYLVISDLVWKSDSASEEAIDFWQHEYPDMVSVDERIAQMQQLGYCLVAHFPQSEHAWQSYYGPLRERVMALEPSMRDSAALKAIKREVTICTEHASEFGYHMFVLMKPD